jgi:type III secretion protein R
MNQFDPISLTLALALMALVPTLAVVCTSFLKISVVLSLVRNALGVQQIPPNLAIYGLALIVSAYVMAPVGQDIYQRVSTIPNVAQSPERLFQAAQSGAEPLRGFMLKHSDARQRDFFVKTAAELWGPDLSSHLRETDFLVLVPAFMLTELTDAFQIGFLIFLPFVVIDLVVSNVLLAMGMMMVSPVMISMPLKLLLFVMADGWTRLIQGLVLTYR